MHNPPLIALVEERGCAKTHTHTHTDWDLWREGGGCWRVRLKHKKARACESVRPFGEVSTFLRASVSAPKGERKLLQLQRQDLVAQR